MPEQRYNNIETTIPFISYQLCRLKLENLKGLIALSPQVASHTYLRLIALLPLGCK